MTSTGRRAGGLGIGIPLTLPSLKNDVLPHPDQPKQANLGLGLLQPSQQMRWPYARSVSAFHSYDSSPTPSNDSSSSSPSSSETDRARRRVSESATHDVLLNYFSPALSDAPGVEEGGRKVYLLSRGLKHPTVRHIRSRSEAFNFPLPPNKFITRAPLKSALRMTSQQFKVVSPPMRSGSGRGWRGTSLSPKQEEVLEGRQGWSPYSSAAPTPRQVSGGHRFSLDSSDGESPPDFGQVDRAPSSCSSDTLVSDSDTDEDAAKLARLHASLLLLNGVAELPLTLPDEKESAMELGGSVEERMAYLCGLGYRYRRGSRARKASWDDETESDSNALEDNASTRIGRVTTHAPVVDVPKARVSSHSASAVTSCQDSPILGLLPGDTTDPKLDNEPQDEEQEGDITIRARPYLPEPTFETLLDADLSYLVDEQLFDSLAGRGAGGMTPPLTTPELGQDGTSPMLLDRWPSPLAQRSSFANFSGVEEIEGCRPYPAAPSNSVERVHATSLEPGKLPNSFSCPSSLSEEREAGIDDEPAQIVQAHLVTRCSVLARPRPFSRTTSSSSLLPAPSQLSLPASASASAQSVLSRPRPVPPSSSNHTFANRSTSTTNHHTFNKTPVRLKKRVQLLPKSASTTTIPSIQLAKSASTIPPIPRRKSSLDVRTAAFLHALSQAPQQLPAQERYHSSAVSYLSHSKESAGRVQPVKPQAHHANGQGGMSKSFSLPTLFTARTPAQRARGETGMSGPQGRRKSVVFVDSDGLVGPPKEGVLVVREMVVEYGLAL